MAEYAQIADFLLSSSFVWVSVTRLKPAKNHSATAMGESQVIFVMILPLPVAAQKRKNFHGSKVGHLDVFLREFTPVQQLGREREILSGERPFLSLGSTMISHFSIDAF
jgi:hypothetical protein